jgi:hypothetical protein
VFFAAVFGERGELHDGAGEKSLGHMKLMYIDKAVVKFNNSQPWQANQKKPNCARRMYAPGSSTKSQHLFLGAKKASYNMLILFYTWMAVPFFWFFFLVCVVKIEPRKSLDMLCIFDLNQSRLSLGLFLPGFSPPD